MAPVSVWFGARRRAARRVRFLPCFPGGRRALKAPPPRLHPDCNVLVVEASGLGFYIDGHQWVLAIELRGPTAS